MSRAKVLLGKSSSYWIRCSDDSCCKVSNDISNILNHIRKSHPEKESNKMSFRVLTIKKLEIRIQRTNNAKDLIDLSKMKLRSRRVITKQPPIDDSPSSSDDEIEIRSSIIRTKRRLKRPCTRKTVRPDIQESIAHGILTKTDSKTAQPISTFCAFCLLESSDLNQLKIHIEQNHAEAKTYECTICRRVFCRQDQHDQHLKVFHMGQFQCKLCGQQYSRRDRLREHKKNKHSVDQKVYNCKLCSKAFSQGETLRKHTFRSHSQPSPEGKQKFTCQFCKKTLITQGQLRLHEFKHVGTKLYACSFCGKKFWTKHTRRMHENNIHKKIGRELWVECQTCKKNFRSEKTLKSHQEFCRRLGPDLDIIEPEIEMENALNEDFAVDPLSIHNEDPVIKLEGVNELVQVGSSKDRDRRELNATVEECVPKLEGYTLSKEDAEHLGHGGYSKPGTELNSDPTFEISKTELTFGPQGSEEQDLVKMPLQLGCRTCPKCNKEFTNRSGLRNHITRHNNKIRGYQFLCDFPLCTRRLATQWSLEYHKRTHTAEKKYKCTECGLSLASPHGYKAHMRRHNGLNPFKCSFCDKAFPVNQQMKLHELRNHIKEKKFQCSFCEAKFLLQRYVVLHERTHTEVRNQSSAVFVTEDFLEITN